jgi:hypothetical protein
VIKARITLVPERQVSTALFLFGSLPGNSCPVFVWQRTRQLLYCFCLAAYQANIVLFMFGSTSGKHIQRDQRKDHFGGSTRTIFTTSLKSLEIKARVTLVAAHENPSPNHSRA